VPHIAGRPLMLVRCPQGADGECFYQKHSAKGSFEGCSQSIRWNQAAFA